MHIDLSNKVQGLAKMFTRTSTMTKYYQDIRQFEVLTLDEEQKIFSKLVDCRKMSEELNKELTNADTNEKRKALLASIKKNNELMGSLKDTIINHNQRFVVSVARKYASDTSIMDLISEGNLGLIEAIETYQPGKGTKFSSWAVYYIRRSINQYKMEVQPQVKQTNRQLTYHVKNSAYNKFVQTYQREPSVEELAEFINENYSKTVNESDLVDTKLSSVDDGYGEENYVKQDVSMAMSVAPSEFSRENDEYTSFVVNNLVGRLSEREQKVINMSFGIGYNYEYDPSDIAKLLGISTERVRKIKRDAISRMRSLALWYQV